MWLSLARGHVVSVGVSPMKTERPAAQNGVEHSTHSAQSVCGMRKRGCVCVCVCV